MTAVYQDRHRHRYLNEKMFIRFSGLFYTINFSVYLIFFSPRVFTAILNAFYFLFTLRPSSCTISSAHPRTAALRTYFHLVGFLLPLKLYPSSAGRKIKTEKRNTTRDYIIALASYYFITPRVYIYIYTHILIYNIMYECIPTDLNRTGKQRTKKKQSENICDCYQRLLHGCRRGLFFMGFHFNLLRRGKNTFTNYFQSAANSNNV